VRPALVVSDPALLAGLAPELRRASAMNALAHAAEALAARGANPVCTLAALRAAELLADGLERDGDDALMLGALLAGYAMGSTGFGLHHVLAQTVVRTCGAPHAQANAAILPHALEALRRRAPAPLAALARALGTYPDGLAARVADLAGGVRLRDLGIERDDLPGVAQAALARSTDLANVPPPPSREELERIALAAW
jgi:maleylacetate reductase